MPKILAECGIRYVVVEKLPRARIDGACFWIDGAPVIGMALQRDMIDNFWFVLRHEIEHVLQRDGQHAEVIAADGFSRRDVQQFLLERAIIPGHHISEAQGRAMAARVPDRFIGEDWRNGSRILSAPEELQIAVAGAAGRHSCLLFSFGTTRAVTMAITDPAGAPL